MKKLVLSGFMLGLTVLASIAVSAQPHSVGDGREAAEPIFRHSLEVEASAWGAASSNESFRPMLSYSNEWGRYALYEQFEAGVGAGLAYSHVFNNQNIRLRAGFSGQLSNDGERTMLDQLFVDLDVYMFGLKAGMERYTPVNTNGGLSFGSYLLSNNARPIPKVWVGILDYWTLPLPTAFTDLGKGTAFDLSQLVQLRGGVSFGRVDDEDNDTYTNDVLLSEKFLYARVGALRVKPYAGLVHSVMMGGTMADGTKIPLDFLNSFLGRQGKKELFGNTFRGETTNAAGAHQGMWDWGFDMDFGGFKTKLFYQRPFADARESKPFRLGVKDCFWGIQTDIQSGFFLKSFVVEFMSTKWQGGDGFPDLVVPNQKGGVTYIYPGDISDQVELDYFKEHVFVKADVAEIEKECGAMTYDNWFELMNDKYHYGKDTGGRSLFLTNYFYPQGWTRGGLSTGAPLFHTKELVGRYAPQGTMTLGSIFPNIRVRAFNVGAKGNLTQKLCYDARVTISRNYGDYREQYIGVAPNYDPSSSWTENENYFFAQPKNEVYSRLNMTYSFCNGWQIDGQASFDGGDLYKAFAFRLGCKYNLRFQK